ncbi:phage major capsid protein [Candidatus Pacearchaeota archaeon]|nr:phage major capsid protein [Candidatus Pacearchaeota archaeon]
MNHRIQKLEERKKALLTQSESILDKAAKEDREPTAEESMTLEANKTDLEAVATKLKWETDLATFAQTAPIIQTGGEGGWPGDTIRQIGTRVKAAFEDDPAKGFKSTREFFKAVVDAGPYGRTQDERLQFLATAGSDEAGTYSNSYGNFLVPASFYANLLTRAAETDPTIGRTTQIPMATPTVSIPARTDSTHTTSVSGGLAVYRRAETQAVTASRMTMEQVKLSAVPLMGLSYATEELLSDSAISFAALIEAGFRDEFGSKILNEKINGTGAGQYEGVINSPCTIAVSAETGQDADSIVYENVINMRSRCWGYQNAIWLYNHDCLPQLMQLVMTIGTSGVPMWQNSAREDRPDLLLGRPAYPTEYCSTLGDAGDLILGNWSQYLEGTYQPLESAESMHVRFEYNERTFRFLMRNDGRCWWRTYLTPKKSAVTLSPFVVIAARA